MAEFSWKAKIELDIADLKQKLQQAENELKNTVGTERKIELGIDTKKLEKAISNLDKMLDSLGKGSGDFKQFENLSKHLESVKSDLSDVKKTFGSLNTNGMNNIVTSINNIDKSLTSLTEKLQIVKKDAAGNIVNTSGIGELGNLFSKIEQHLDSLHKSFGEIGDGDGLKPLINQVNELKTAMSGLKMNLNLDLGDIGKGSDQKIAETTRRYAQAYKSLFEQIKSSGRATKEMWQFVAPENVSDAELVGIYKSMIGRAESKYATTSIKDGKKVTTNNFRNWFSDYYREIRNARDTVRNAEKASANGLSLESIFGKTDVDLSGVVSQLELIANKLDDISSSAKSMGETFSSGINVGASVEEITKLTDRVKELENELQKVQSVNTGSGVSGGAGNSNNIISTILPSDSDFSKVLKNLNRTKSELSDIVEITKQVHYDKNGKPVESYTLKDKYGSTEIYGQTSKTKDGNIIRKNIKDTSLKDAQETQKALDAQEKANQKILEQQAAMQRSRYSAFEKEQTAYESSSKQNSDLEKRNQLYRELLESIYKYGELSKKQLTVNGLTESETNELSQLEKKITDIQNSPILSSQQIEASNKKLLSLFSTLEKIETAQEKANQKTSNSVIKSNYDDALKAVSEYEVAQNKVNKFQGNGDYSSESFKVAQKRAEDLRKAYEDAIATLEEFNDELKNGYEGSSMDKIGVSAKELENNLKHAQEVSKGSLESVAAAMDKQKSSIDSAVTNAEKLFQTLKKSGQNFFPSDEYNKILHSTEKELKNLKDLQAEITKQGGLADADQMKRLNDYTTAIENNREAAKNMSASQKGSTPLQNVKAIERINKALEQNTRMSAEAKAQLKAYISELKGNPAANVKEIEAAWRAVVQAEKEAGRGGKSILSAIGEKAFYGLAGQIASMVSLWDVINVAKQGIGVVKDLDTALTEMRKVSDETLQSLKNYQATTFDTANSIGTTAEQLQQSTADWMRLGESMDSAAESAKAANVLLNVSEFDNIDSATEALVSMSQAYKDLDKMDIVDIANNIGNNYSISTDGLATALQESASALVTANNDINEAAAIITAGNAITQDPASVGNGARTIALRLVGTEEAKKELSDLGEETDGMVTTVSKLRDTIKSATAAATADGKGFDILDENGNYKSTYEIMQGLADLYDDIVAKDKELGTNNLNLLLETIAGECFCLKFMETYFYRTHLIALIA